MRTRFKSATECVATGAKRVKDDSKGGGGSGHTHKKVWDKPLSQSFYTKLQSRVEAIFQSLGYVRGWRDEFMKYIDRYLLSGECPQRRYCEEFVLVIFYALKGEIDAAVERSAACRRRAAKRRARKAVEKENNIESQDNDKLHEGDESMITEPPTTREEDVDAGGHACSRIEAWRRRYGEKGCGVS